jgi:glycerophosphoryl diester phosphodiesterase
MNKRKLALLLSASILIAGIIFPGSVTEAQSSGKLNLLSVGNARQTQKLLHYTGDRLPLVSAHRGGSLPGWPENCLATFENTLSHTYAIMECDPRYTKDSLIVLHHDPGLGRTTNGQGNVSDYTLSELKKLRLKDRNGDVTDYQIPTLDEALEWAKGKTILVLDQKDVPVAERVKKTVEHNAEANVIMIVYSFAEAKTCYGMNKNIMMEVMVPGIEEAIEFEKTGVPWRNVIAFVGHEVPQKKEVYDFLHQRGVMCMAGSSRNADRKYLTNNVKDFNELKGDYDVFLTAGIDIIETDVPRELGKLLYKDKAVPSKKSKFFR